MIQTAPQSNLNSKQLNFLEFFCEGLAKDSNKSLKGAAILSLYDYVSRTLNEKDKPYFSSFFSFFSFSHQDKKAAILAIIFVLFEIKGKNVSTENIKVLNWMIKEEKDNSLSEIVRSKILEPLKLFSLEELTI